MPTQEERLTALEQNFASFQKEVATHIREVDENFTIMLGVMRDQGRDIKRTVQRLETIDERLNTIEQRFDRLDTKFDEHTALLTQILARLPKTS
jgi:DNA repair ATPase RecN